MRSSDGIYNSTSNIVVPGDVALLCSTSLMLLRVLYDEVELDHRVIIDHDAVLHHVTVPPRNDNRVRYGTCTRAGACTVHVPYMLHLLHDCYERNAQVLRRAASCVTRLPSAGSRKTTLRSTYCNVSIMWAEISDLRTTGLSAQI